jgi:hypothetical protein
MISLCLASELLRVNEASPVAANLSIEVTGRREPRVINSFLIQLSRTYSQFLWIGARIFPRSGDFAREFFGSFGLLGNRRLRQLAYPLTRLLELFWA